MNTFSKESPAGRRGAGPSLAALVPALVLAALAGCATPTGPTASTEAVSFDQAVASATDSLLTQARQSMGVMAQFSSRSVVVDPMLESGTGQQSALTRALEDKVAQRLRAGEFELLPFQGESLSKARYLLVGTLDHLQEVKDRPAGRPPLRIDLSLVELKSGNVVAQASTRAVDNRLDATPTPYYRDSPVLVKDKVVDGYIRTAQARPGTPADADYFQRVSVGTTIQAATQAYNAEQYPQALELYRAALATPAGEQMRTRNGIYLSNWKLGRDAEAEAAFGKVVETALANNNLGVKFLFNPGSTDFWPEPKISGPYPFWLRQIARHVAASKVCLNVVGHTSHTGSEAYNDRLSEQRALAIRQKLVTEVSDLAPRLKAGGVGFRQNLIGTGTDDASDALDRRVEFKVQGCGG
ncbi:OmpA family protein [Azohydromonas caseinilytica]|uniref:OmpA family protein n=1 Tax=Azohydromonas caseinilytica TaxID=2728836 RepID=A0A848FEF1_9BURK|nr:OmpA family protein [Azohydromonas caseinilytica]NML16530.1 OmpA family protein [Azohydromonas caseinilytica]